MSAVAAFQARRKSTYRTHQSSALLLRFGKRWNPSEPLLLRAAPDLMLRHKLIALAHGADANVVGLRPVAGSGRIDWRSATRTERLHALIAALAGLHIDRGLARQDAKVTIRRRDRDTEGGAGQHLAVGAVADRRPLRIGIRRIGDVAAVAASVDLHPCFPQITNL